MSGLIGSHAELQMLLKIQSVDIQTSSGISLYQKQFQHDTKDSSLVSGFTTALSYMFDTVTDTKKIGFERFKSNNMFLTRHNLQHSSVIVISSVELEKAILKQVERSHRTIHRVYEKNFKGSRSGYDPLPVEEIDKIFIKNNFKIGLLEKLELDHNKVRQLLKSEGSESMIAYYLEQLIAFDQVPKADPYFLIKQLLAYLYQQGVNENMSATLILKSWSVGAFKRYTGPITSGQKENDNQAIGYEVENLNYSQNDISP